MGIQRWDPQRDLVRLQQNVRQMFEEALGRSSSLGTAEPTAPGGWRPPLDLFEEADHYVLRADLPGVPASDVELRIDNGNLILLGERKIDQEAYLRVERPSGRFAAQIGLPPSVDQDRIQAHHRNGVLEVVLPKKEHEQSSQIEVAGG